MFGQILPCLKLYKKKLKSVKARNGFEKLQLQEKTEEFDYLPMSFQHVTDNGCF